MFCAPHPISAPSALFRRRLEAPPIAVRLQAPRRPRSLLQLRPRLRLRPRGEAPDDLREDLQEEEEDLRLDQEQGQGHRGRGLRQEGLQNQGQGEGEVLSTACTFFVFEVFVDLWRMEAWGA